MATFIAFILNLIGFGVIAMILVQGFLKRVDFISYRNLYLLGYLLFQVFSGSMVISSENVGAYVLENPRKAYTTFLVYTIVYLAIYLLSYHKLNLVGWAAGAVSPKRNYVVNDWLFLMSAVGVVGLGLAGRFGLGALPVFNHIFSLVPIAPLACAIVGWVWGGRRFNLFVLLAGGMIVIVCLFLTTGMYGRRPLVASFMALLCGAYFRMRLTMSLKAIALYLTPIVLGMIFTVGAFTLARGMIRHGGTHQVVIQKVLSTDFSSAFTKVADGSPDAAGTLWVLDAFPQRIEPKPFFSFKYMIYHPVPRKFWEDNLEYLLGPKPIPLSLEMAVLSRMKGVAWGSITLPPGVLGYARAEGGFLTLIAYALFFGQFCRFFDEIIRRNPGNPFMLLAVICSLGELIGLARGDIAVFTNFIFLGFIGDYLILLLIRLFIGVPQEKGRPFSYSYPPGSTYAVPNYR